MNAFRSDYSSTDLTMIPEAQWGQHETEHFLTFMCTLLKTSTSTRTKGVLRTWLPWLISKSHSAVLCPGSLGFKSYFKYSVPLMTSVRTSFWSKFLHTCCISHHAAAAPFVQLMTRCWLQSCLCKASSSAPYFQVSCLLLNNYALVEVLLG